MADDSFSSVYGPAAFAAGGNIAGAGIGFLLNEAAADNQLARQKELTSYANALNQQNAREQASNEVNGLKNAGLNPASADGSGAPVVSGGQASANSVPTLGNIFDGIAQIITAAKAPSEIASNEVLSEKTRAETSAINQKVTLLNPQMMKKVNSEIDNLVENARSTRNFNESFEAGDKFLRDHSASVFNQLYVKLEKDGLLDSLSPDTIDTLAALANGDIHLGQGQIESLNKLIDEQLRLSDADRRIVQNAFDNAVTLSQWKSKPDFSALVHLPSDTRKMLYKQYDKVTAEIGNINQLIETGKADEALKKAQKLRTDFERESSELNDVKWLAKQGRNEDVDIRTSEQSLEQFQSFMHDVVRTAESIASGYAAGRGIGAGKSAPAPSQISPPSESQIMKVNTPKSFGRYMDFR